MKKFLQSHIVTTGLAIFSMFFGAGNLMYPLEVGMESGDKVVWGLLGFLSTAACLPVLGLFAMILFDGDYKAFFNRLGSSAGSIMIFISLVIIGPLIAIPRIVTLSHTMIAPFIPMAFLQDITLASSFVFSIIFLGITFLLTFRENNIVDVLGNIISPLLLAALAIIIGAGYYWNTAVAVVNTSSIGDIVFSSLRIGYETLDLLGAIFFSSIILTILRKTAGKEVEYNQRGLALMSLKAGVLGVGLLAMVYVGMSFLGVYYGQGITNINSGELFSVVSFRVLGQSGALVIATAVLMACLSTAIALAAVLAEYIQYELCQNSIGYVQALIITLLSCIPLSTAGLKSVLTLTGGPICYIGYPVIITLTFCNIAYKLFNFKPVKMPVFLTFVAALLTYLYYNPFTGM
jgi:LIVCS family branched-chain amino acid:cation transporter